MVSLGCSDGGVTRVEDPYGGAPFPNRRTAFADRPELAVVSNNGDDSLTLVDLAVPELVGSGGIGLDPVDLDGPHHVALDRAHGEVLTVLAYPVPPTAPGPHAAHGSSQRRGMIQRLALSDLSPLGALPVETNPGDIVLSDDGNLLIVSHFDLVRAQKQPDLESKRATLALVDPRNVGVEGGAATFVPTCIAPHGVALSRPSGERAYVACYGEDALAVVDTTDPDAPPELVSLGIGGEPGRPFYGPYAAVMSPGGALVAVSNTESGDVRLFDAEAHSFLPARLATGGAPYFPAWADDETELIVPVQTPDGVLRVTLDGTVRARREFSDGECVKPHEVVRSHGGRFFLVCEGDHVGPGTLLELDASSLETLAVLELGVYPDRLAIGAAR
jgi:DNA-binding beta-propeller fold protein YncE